VSLLLDARVRRGSFTLDARLELPEGEVLAVLGPNGSGKSTLLAVLAGLLAPNDGVVRWRDRHLTRVPGSGSVPPSRRRVGLLGQDALLFPHLTAAENVAFGPRSQGRSRRDATALARRWLERLDVEALADRRPREISGGQAARVALARALAAEPEVLLLDEPLAALDVAAAPGLRQTLADAVRETGTTTVLVSHDLLDAVVLADRVAVLRDGTVVEEGPRAEVLGAPRTAFTAALVGVNLIPAAPDGDRWATPVGRLRAAVPPSSSDADDGTARRAVQLRVRPAAVVLSAPDGDRTHPGENSWPGRILLAEPATGGVRVRVRHADGFEVLADVDAAALDPALLRPGAEVRAHVAADAVHAV
jgi:molybdate transport system ATP-binding protein